jgi:hypothetical protein
MCLMCGLCGALGRGPSWEQEGIADSEARWRLRRQAAAVAAELSALLASKRIKVGANPDFGLLVSFPTGGTDIVNSLAEFWHLLQRRGVGIPDPLDGL